MTVSGNPLPTGWTEHVSPDGTVYYHHAGMGHSTYTRPEVAGGSQPDVSQPLHTGPPPGITGPPPGGYTGPPPSIALPEASVMQPRKDKPKRKDSIPGADGWLRVTTTLGHVFYTHKQMKRSEWSIPEEIKEQVHAMMRAEKDQEGYQASVADAGEHYETKRKRTGEEASNGSSPNKRLKGASGDDAVGEVEEIRELSTTRRLDATNSTAKADDDEPQANEGLQGSDEVDDDDEAAWQRNLAAEMVADAAAAAAAATKPNPVPKSSTAPSASAPNYSLPPPGYPHHPPPTLLATSTRPPAPSLSPEEASALFRRMLTSLNGTPDEVDPMAPWDMELPKFVHRAEYAAVPSLRDRQDTFNDWCKLRLREKRALREASKDAHGPAKLADEPGISKPEEIAKSVYQSLLAAEVKSTRTTWTDFRKAWRKDRRFYGYGRDDKQRETKFRSYIKQLGEAKRAAALKAESDFLELLSSELPAELRIEEEEDRNTEAWRDAKRTPGLIADSRYDAVGSATRRAELFAEWRRGRNPISPALQAPSPQQRDSDAETQTASAQRALNEREQKVKAENMRLSGRNQAALRMANHEDSTVSFNQLLIDQVRDPLATYRSVMSTVSQDPRSREAKLSEGDRRRLFDQHIDGLLSKRIKSLRTVFEKHAPTLDVTADVALPLVREDAEVERLRLDRLPENTSLRDEFSRWNQERWQQSQRDFQEMLKENAFVDFWGRLRKETSTSAANDVAAPAVEDDDEDADVPSLTKMAASIDLAELHSVLRGDARYRAFKHVPQEREMWIRSHLENMASRKQTVHSTGQH